MNLQDVDALALEYALCRAHGSKADRVSYWHWLYKNHKAIYSRVVAKVKEQDEDVDRVRQRLLKEGY